MKTKTKIKAGPIHVNIQACSTFTHPAVVKGLSPRPDPLS